MEDKVILKYYMKYLVFTLVIFASCGNIGQPELKEFRKYNEKYLKLNLDNEEHFIFMINVACISCSKDILHLLDVKGIKKLDVVLIGEILNENKEYFDSIKNVHNLFYDKNSKIIKYDILSGKGLFMHISNNHVGKITNLNSFDPEIINYLEKNKFTIITNFNN